MKLFVISSPSTVENEIDLVVKLFDEGLEFFHLRKPKYSTSRLSEYLNEIPKEYRNRISVHSHHELSVKYDLLGIHLTRDHRKKIIRTWLKLKLLKFQRPDLILSTSFHNLSSLYRNQYTNLFNYVFLSPVFGSISKRGYEAGFNDDQLKAALRKTNYKVIALGGVDITRIDKIKEMNFDGVALLGAIWNSKKPIESYKAIVKQLSQLDINVKKIVRKG